MVNMTYEPFSEEPEYLELNRRFVRSIVPRVKRLDCIVDLACGTGTLTELLLAALRDQRTGQGGWSTGSEALQQLRIVGVDCSRGSLELAKDKFAQHGWPTPLDMGPSEREAHDEILIIFVEASADCLPIAATVADLVLLGHAVHCFTDKGKLFKEVYRTLRPGGIFTFNSSFYAGSIVSGTERFYEVWMKQALRYVKRWEDEYGSRRAGGTFRKRGRGQPAFSNRWLSPIEYTQALTEHGFDVVSIAEREILMSQRNLETVGAYAGLASVLLSGYPVELACEALEKSVGYAFEVMGVEVVPRIWLEVISAKK
jgi:ubiquinone/menaquinone biosynthesis C-methylase UbiE